MTAPALIETPAERRALMVVAMVRFLREVDGRHGRPLTDDGEDYETTLYKRATERVDENLRRLDLENRKVLRGAVALIRGTYCVSY